MTRLRSLVVAATIVLPITLSLAALARDRLLWPFSHYPMYSVLNRPTATVTRAVGVMGDGRELPLPPRIEPKGLGLHSLIRNARQQPDSGARLTRIATAIWVEYERLRAAGEIDGPPLAAVRIYRETIQFETKPHTRRATLVTRGPAP